MPTLNDDRVEKLIDAEASAGDAQNNSLRNELREIAEQQTKLIEQQNEILKQLAASQKQARKDFWDRIAAIAPILSGSIIALGGTYFTLTFNEQQLKLQEVQTIEKFIPHLLGDEKSKRAAVLAISSLGNAKLAARVAAIFASPGTVSALESIARNDQNSSDRRALTGALDRALDNMAEGYRAEKRYEDAIATYKKVLALREGSYGPGSTQVVPSMDRLADLYKAHSDYSEAEGLLKRAAEILKNQYGKDSMQYASGLRRLASLYADQGNDAKSKDLLSQASAIEQKLPAASRTQSAEDADPIDVIESADVSADAPGAKTKTGSADSVAPKPDTQKPADRSNNSDAPTDPAVGEPKVNLLGPADAPSSGSSGKTESAPSDHNS